MRIRDATAQDLESIQQIYSFYVLNSLVTYELDVPSVEEMTSRFASVRSKGFPYIVAVDEDSNEIEGYAYVSTFRERAGFNNTVENSIYVKHGVYRKGIGSRLLSCLIEKCSTKRLRQIIAVISGGADTTDASVAIHEKFGFEYKGILSAVGYKFDRWVDCMFYQLAIDDGDDSPSFKSNTKDDSTCQNIATAQFEAPGS